MRPRWRRCSRGRWRSTSSGSAGFCRTTRCILNCKPPGGPRQFQLPYGVQFVEDRERKRIFVLIGSGNNNFRIIYTDGRSHAGQVGGDDDNPLYYGRSVARWEGDTLVADTRGFNEDFWFTNGGLPHTDQLRLIERFTRAGFRYTEVRGHDRGPGRVHETVVQPVDASLGGGGRDAAAPVPGQQTRTVKLARRFGLTNGGRTMRAYVLGGLIACGSAADRRSGWPPTIRSRRSSTREADHADGHRHQDRVDQSARVVLRQREGLDHRPGHELGRRNGRRRIGCSAAAGAATR